MSSMVEEFFSNLSKGDLALAPADALALLAYFVDRFAGTDEELQDMLLKLGLSQHGTFDPTVHAIEGMLPGDPIIAYSAPLNYALDAGRKRLRERFPRRAH